MRKPAKAMVLMYHRIADPPFDPWGLSVSPLHFREQLECLVNDFNIVPLKELVDLVSNQDLKPNTVAISFDDGYRDNLIHGKPLLDQYRVPATFFIPAWFVQHGKAFWWDVLAHLFFEWKNWPLGEQLSFFNGEIVIDVPGEIPDSVELQSIAGWRWPQDPPGPWVKAYLKCWMQLKPLPLREIVAFIEELGKALDFNGELSPLDLPMSVGDLHQMSASPLVSIGAHTVTHPALSNQSFKDQYSELEDGWRFLQKELAMPLKIIAYPFGDFNEDTIAAAKALGYEAAFTTQGALVSNGHDLLRIPRYQVRNWNGDQFRSQLRTWFNQ